MHLLTHGKSKPLNVPREITSPVKPSAPQISHDALTKKDDVISSPSTTTIAFHTANESPSLYPTLSDTSQRHTVNKQPSEFCRKRHSTSISSPEGKKACIASTPAKVQQSPHSWFSQFLRK